MAKKRTSFVPPKMLVLEHAEQDFDLAKLQKEFKLHCSDYGTELTTDSKSQALDFASKVLFTIGPESKSIKAAQIDKYWKFVFKVNDELHDVFVSPNKNLNYEYQHSDTEMVLSIKQASLLCMDTLARLCAISMRTNNVIMTYLARAVFSKEDLEEIAAILGQTPGDALVTLNESCQPEGQYLPNSDGSVAVAAVLYTTSNIKDENRKRAIVFRITRQYLRNNKKVDMVKVKQLAEYTTGGIPSELSYEKLMLLFDEGIAKRAAFRFGNELSTRTTKIASLEEQLKLLTFEDKDADTSSDKSGIPAFESTRALKEKLAGVAEFEGDPRIETFLASLNQEMTDKLNLLPVKDLVEHVHSTFEKAEQEHSKFAGK